MNQVLTALEMGVGLSEGDRKLGDHLEAAPDTFEQHPIYIAGFDAGFAARSVAALTPEPGEFM